MLKCFQVGDLLPGQAADITEIVGHPDSVSRLYEIGIRVGVPLEMMQSGKVCVVRVTGTKLCLRPRGVKVLVQPK